MIRICISFWIFCATGLISYSQADLLEPKSMVPETCMAPFYHGVASGDPLSDRVIIWTRVTPATTNQAPVIVSWKMATDTAMSNIVQSGSVMTTYERDYTVKIDVTNLNPDTWYYYEFYAYGNRSIQGRTRTTPLQTTLKDSLRYAVVSCANLEAGYFNVYAALNNRADFDAVICLGDYYYEYETGGYSPNPQTPDRTVDPTHEIVTLDDYRMRHSTYKIDADLRRLHQLFPWFCIWDDHESANDSWMNGAENHNPGEGDWILRKNASKKAYFEWMPIRDNDASGQYQIYRSISYGSLVDLIFLDTRLEGRNEQVSFGSSQLNSSTRTLLGTTQRDWLLNKLSSSTASYKILAQQVMIAPLTAFGVALNMDQWDGYPYERTSILNHVLLNGIQNFVVLTGDIHTSWASEIRLNATSTGVEFVTPSVTSPGMEFASGIGASAILAANSHIKWINLDKKGFMIVNVTQAKVQSDWFFMNTIDSPDPSYNWAKSYYKNNNSNLLNETNIITLPRNDLFAVTPQYCPRIVPEIEDPEPTASLSESDNIIVMGLYPNPVTTLLNVQFANMLSSHLEMQILDEQGKHIWNEEFFCQKGSWIKQINTADLPTGKYMLIIQDKSGFYLHRSFIKQ